MSEPGVPTWTLIPGEGWDRIFSTAGFPTETKDEPQVTENWELPSEYRQYAEMIAVWNLSLLDRAWQEWRDVEGFASFPGKTYSVRPTPIPSKDDNSESEDWAGLQPPRPGEAFFSAANLLEAWRELAKEFDGRNDIRAAVRAKALAKAAKSDPRSESFAKALRFT